MELCFLPKATVGDQMLIIQEDIIVVFLLFVWLQTVLCTLTLLFNSDNKAEGKVQSHSLAWRLTTWAEGSDPDLPGTVQVLNRYGPI